MRGHVSGLGLGLALLAGLIGLSPKCGLNAINLVFVENLRPLRNGRRADLAGLGCSLNGPAESEDCFGLFHSPMLAR